MCIDESCWLVLQCGMKGLASRTTSKLAMQVCHHAAVMLPHSTTFALTGPHASWPVHR